VFYSLQQSTGLRGGAIFCQQRGQLLIDDTSAMRQKQLQQQQPFHKQQLHKLWLQKLWCGEAI
jgi:radical SAM superfamily enzyme